MIHCENLQVVPFPGVGAELIGLELSGYNDVVPVLDGAETLPYWLAATPSSSSSSLSSSSSPSPFQEPDAHCMAQFRALWNQHAVLLVRNQSLTEHSLLHLAQRLGDPKPAGSRGYYMRAGHPHGSGRTSTLPHVSVMSNLNEQGEPVSVTSGHGSQWVDWHQDDSYTNTPAQGALLYNTHHPVNGGGNTSFCNLYTAYETLPPTIQALIEPWHLVHDISRNSAGHVRPGLTLPQTWEDVQGPAHPLVIVHPQTGRKALHLGRKQPAPTSYIYELPTVEGHALLEYLWHHAITTAVWTHDSWRPGDLVIWDNLATMHQRSSVDPTQRREMLRVLLRGQGLEGVSPGVHTIVTTANDQADQEARLKDGTAMPPPSSATSKDEDCITNHTSVTTATQDNNNTTAASCIPASTDTSSSSSSSWLVSSSTTTTNPVVLPTSTGGASTLFGSSTTTTGILAGLVTLLWTIVSRVVSRRRRRRHGRISANETDTPSTTTPNQTNVAVESTTGPVHTQTTPATPSSSWSPSQQYLSEPRIHVFWSTFLAIYLCFQSFSCGRADRLWRISHVYQAAPAVLLKPYGISFVWYEALAPYMAMVETVVLLAMILLTVQPFLVGTTTTVEPGSQATVWWRHALVASRRWLALLCGCGWLYLHAYEHSLTGGSHTHLMPAICMMALALPPTVSLAIIRQWNVFLLFSAGLSKLFNGSHHAWWAWMDGQSMQFYFDNSRQAVPEPFYTWTMPPNVWFAAAQCTLSAIFELSTFLVLVSRSYRIVFPFLGAVFHGMIWYTLGVNYLTSVVIQFTLVLDQNDWKYLVSHLQRLYHVLVVPANPKLIQEDPADSQEESPRGGSNGTRMHSPEPADSSKETLADRDTPPTVPTSTVSSKMLAALPIVNAMVLVLVMVQQLEFWPLSNIPMYSGYRPHIGYNVTHIANRTYLDHLVLESAPHVWSRHWTDVMVTEHDTGRRSKMTFCARSKQERLAKRGVKDLCLIPEGNMFDTERHTQANHGGDFRVEPPLDKDTGLPVPHSMRPGGWNRQKPIVVMAELPGRYHVYCRHSTLSPAQDWLHRNCAFLQSMGIDNVQTELVVRLGTGDLTLASVNCVDISESNYAVNRVPSCIQSPWESL